MKAMAAVEPVRWLTSRSRARFVSPSPASDTSWPSQRRRKPGMRRTSRADIAAGIGWSVIGSLRVGRGRGREGVERHEVAERDRTRLDLARVVGVELLEELAETAAKLHRTVWGKHREAADHQLAERIVAGLDHPAGEAALDLVADRVEDDGEDVVNRAADVGATAGEERAVEAQAELRDLVARLDDPRHDARAGDPDELPLLEDVDVVVELGRVRAQRLRQSLDRPGVIGLGDHRLQDSEADGIAQRLEGPNVGHDPLTGR